jgi:type IV pilus assembly protein PilM
MMDHRLRPEMNDPRNGDAEEHASPEPSEPSWSPFPARDPEPEPAAPAAHSWEPVREPDHAPDPEPGDAPSEDAEPESEVRVPPGPSEQERRRRRLAFRRGSEAPTDDEASAVQLDAESGLAPEAGEMPAESRKERKRREKVEREAEKAALKAEKEQQKAALEAEKETAKAEEAAAKHPAKAEKEAAKLEAKAEKSEKPKKPPKPKREPKAKDDHRVKKLVGLKIGASQIAAARVHNNGAPELVEAFREPLDHGVVVSGEIRDTAALAGALERFFELHKLPKKGVRLGLSNNRIGVRVFEIEGVTDERQLENAIRFRAEEVLPIPLDEAVLDYVVLDDEVREDTRVQRILLVVAYKEVVDRYLEACHGAGIEVVGIDLEAFALLRALQEPSDEPAGDSAFVAVAVGHDRTTIAVSAGRVCEFTRVLDWGGWALNVAIARALDKAPSEVESIKRHLSFTEVVPVEGLEPDQAAKAHEAVQRALAAFARELVASLHFYQAQPGALGIGEIVLTGGAAHMSGFDEAVGRLIGAPVRLGDPFRRVRIGTHAGSEDQAGSFAVAIGLGIED